MERIDQIFGKYRLIDLSHTFQEGMPGFLPYIHFPNLSRKIGDKYNSNIIQITEHHGTHADAPFHVGGRKCINEIPLDVCHGRCNLIDLRYKKTNDFVLAEEIEKWQGVHGQINKEEIVLLMYGWDKNWKIKSKRNDSSDFYYKFPGLSEEAAEYIGNLGIKTIGTDAPTIDAYPNFEKSQSSGVLEPAHKILLIKHGVVVIECLKNLDRIPPKGAYIFAFPLKILNGSGSPIRAVAFIPKD